MMVDGRWWMVDGGCYFSASVSFWVSGQKVQIGFFCLSVRVKVGLSSLGPNAAPINGPRLPR